jgi:hypothetical protein
VHSSLLRTGQVLLDRVGRTIHPDRHGPVRGSGDRGGHANGLRPGQPGVRQELHLAGHHPGRGRAVQPDLPVLHRPSPRRSRPAHLPRGQRPGRVHGAGPGDGPVRLGGRPGCFRVHHRGSQAERRGSGDLQAGLILPGPAAGALPSGARHELPVAGGGPGPGRDPRGARSGRSP